MVSSGLNRWFFPFFGFGQDNDDKHRLCVPVAAPRASQPVSCESSTRSSESPLVLHPKWILGKNVSASAAEGAPPQCNIDQHV